jgi:exopolyphosphatase/guanosine-5'-triphosphate,3'-diphosphate pyrophosphatase
MPGMKDFRADMIVVGACLIDYIIKKHSIPQIKVSNYALKEGVLTTQIGLGV